MRKVPDKILQKIIKHIMLNKKNIYIFENLAIDEIMCKNIVEPDRPKMTIWRMRITPWVAKATSTDSECALVIAFPL
jgi:hypothetical protein